LASIFWQPLALQLSLPIETDATGFAHRGSKSPMFFSETVVSAAAVAQYQVQWLPVVFSLSYGFLVIFDRFVVYGF